MISSISFSNASGRLDSSRQSILDEANAIEAAWRRIDLAEPHAQDRLRVRSLMLFIVFVLIGSLLIGTMPGDQHHRRWFYRIIAAAGFTSIIFVIL